MKASLAPSAKEKSLDRDKTAILLLLGLREVVLLLLVDGGRRGGLLILPRLDLAVGRGGGIVPREGNAEGSRNGGKEEQSGTAGPDEKE